MHYITYLITIIFLCIKFYFSVCNKMNQDHINMAMMALLAINTILLLVCLFKKGGSEEEFVATVAKKLRANVHHSEEEFTVPKKLRPNVRPS